MAMLRAGMVNFSKGVLSDRVQGRVDVAAYNAGLKRGENVIILKQGAFSIRPGWKYVSEALEPGEWLFPFQFSDEQPYALAFGQQFMQPLTAGGVVTEEELAVAGFSNTNPAVVTIAHHGYAAGDRIFLDTLSGALGAVVNRRVWEVVASLGENTFSIDLDATALPAFSGSTGGITRTDPPPAPPPVPPTPPPYVPPDPPPTVGGGGGGGVNCVAVDTPILMAEGFEVPAGNLMPGSLLRTQHEETLAWGDHAVTAIMFVEEPVYRGVYKGRVIRATAAHRVWLNGGWVEWASLPSVRRDGRDVVAKITVADAHTYVAAGLLSHNIKVSQPEVDQL